MSRRTAIDERLAHHRPVGLRTAVGACGALVVAAVCSALAGFVGAVVGAGVVLAWGVVTAPYAIAVGHLGVIALGTGDLGLPAVLAVEAGFLLVVLGSIEPKSGREWPEARPAIVAVIAALGLWGSVAVGRSWTDSLGLVAALLVAVGATAVYGLHRYERVRLGLVDQGGRA